jgi:hypothetical protein
MTTRTTRALVPGLLLLVTLGGCSEPSGNGVATAGEGTTTSTRQSSQQDQAVRFAQCLREHGLDVADPEDGKPPTINQDSGAEQEVKAATEACREYAPTRDRTLSSEDVDKLRRVAACMRENGFPDFPDPDPDQGGISIDDDSGIDTRSPEFTAAQERCGMGGPPPSSAPGGNG